MQIRRRFYLRKYIFFFLLCYYFAHRRFNISLHLNVKIRFKSSYKAGGQSPTGNVCYIFIGCKFTIKYSLFVHVFEALPFVLQVLNETRAKKCNRHLQIRNTIFKPVIKLYISCFPIKCARMVCPWGKKHINVPPET